MSNPNKPAKASGGAAVSLRGLSKQYGGVAAVQNLTLCVQAGEFVALLGPSGCGKSTILKCIAGFECLDGGEIWIGDHRIDHIPPDGRNIGMVFQSYALFPHMTVARNVAFPLRMRGVDRQEQQRRVDEALQITGLQGLDARLPAQLSGGQQQRVALARSLVYRPPVLLLDEPLSALDKKLRERMQIELKQLQRELGVTVLFVTHDQHEALTMADRIAVVRDGQIEQIGTAPDLYDHPETEFVADFIGETNCLPGEIRDCGEDGTLTVLTEGCLMGCVAGGRTDLEYGETVNIRVRPEHTTLNSDLVSGLPAVIKDQVFEGYTTAVTIETRSGAFVRARFPTAKSDELKRGGPITFSWTPASALVFKV